MPVDRKPLPTAPSDQYRERPFVEIAGERFRGMPMAAGVRDRLKRVYYSALMLQSGGRGLPCRLPHGEIVRALPKHRHMSWNPDEYEAFREAVEPGTTALDIGANVGAYSLLLGQWAGASGHVFAFEPAPDIFSGLSRHIQMNGLTGVVTPVAAAVGDRVGRATLVVAGTHGESRLASGGEDAAATVQVPLTTVDAFCAERALTPRFMKVDVEGFELAVLRGARETIRRAGASLALFVEMHPSVWPGLGTSRAEILEELDAQHLAIVPLVPAADIWSIEGQSVRLRPR